MRKERASVAFINSLIGIDISPQQMVTLCERLQLGPAQLLWEQQEEEKDDDGNTTAVLEVTVPPTRSDILHAVDIAEDIGIAYGYNNIVKRTPATCTVGREQPLNQLGDLLREEVSRFPP
jgi:phenylalanyl-tRNA synthetase beta chain